MSAAKRSRAQAAADKAVVKTPQIVQPLASTLSTWQQLLISLRHLLPFLLLVLLGHTASHFLLLTVINLALSLSTLAVVRVATSMRGKYTNMTDRVAGLATELVKGIRVMIAVTGLFGWVVAMLIEDSEQRLLRPELIGSAVFMVAAALWHGRQQYLDDLKYPADEAAAKGRDRPLIFANLFCCVLVVMWTPFAFELGRAGLWVLASVLTGLFLVRDLRPDLVRRYGPGQL